MQINFYATLRPIVGGKTVEVPEAVGQPVPEVLRLLVARFPGLEKEMLRDDGTLHGHVHFFVNGRDVRYLPEGMDYVIKPTDTINIFPPVGGG